MGVRLNKGLVVHEWLDKGLGVERLDEGLSEGHGNGVDDLQARVEDLGYGDLLLVLEGDTAGVVGLVDGYVLVFKDGRWGDEVE